MSRMRELDPYYLLETLKFPNYVFVGEILRAYKEEKKWPDRRCFYCGEYLQERTAFFCPSSYTDNQILFGKTEVRGGLSICMYKFYCEHPEMVVEMITG